jgi:uncharacterized protein (TIGR02996 family)
MTTDADFLRNLLHDPADDTTRLVYADWLDEQGDATARARAEFLRLELEIAALPDAGSRREAVDTRLRERAAALAPEWLAVVSHPVLEECQFLEGGRFQFRYKCPARWERLTPTPDVRIRDCKVCHTFVHYCETIKEARAHAVRGHCVALSLALVRRPDDLRPTEAIVGWPADPFGFGDQA